MSSHREAPYISSDPVADLWNAGSPFNDSRFVSDVSYSGYYTPSSTPVGNAGESIPWGAPQTGGGGAAGFANRVPLAAGAAAVATAGAAAAVLGHRKSGRDLAHANSSQALAVPGTADEA